MTGIAQLFHAGKAAVMLNVGPLVIPLTRTSYSSANNVLYPKPPKLFSHNDQTSVWLSSKPEGATRGWGGNMGDLALSGNTEAMFTCMSVSGNALFLSGKQASPLRLGTSGLSVPGSLTGVTMYGSSSVKSAYDNLITQSSSHAMEDEYNRVTKRSVDARVKISDALASQPETNAAYSQFPATGNSLASQLKVVARLIAAQTCWG